MTGSVHHRFTDALPLCKNVGHIKTSHTDTNAVHYITCQDSLGLGFGFGHGSLTRRAGWPARSSRLVCRYIQHLKGMEAFRGYVGTTEQWEYPYLYLFFIFIG